MAAVSKVFISYRRDDSAGHAGRLFDGLVDRFGEGHVFMDVSDLQPGQDYVAELDRALSQADCVLALIGPRWLTATNAAGQRRIDDAEDFVCREIGAGLARQVVVIPVLVHGATMPAAADMPPALAPLARRQAIVLTDQRWERDLDELVRHLSAGSGMSPAAPPSARPAKSAMSKAVKWLAPSVLLLSALGVAWIGWRGTGVPAEAAASPGATAATPTRTADESPASGKRASAPQRFAVALPQVSEVKFRTSRAQLRFSILAIRLEPRDADTQALSLLVRMTNGGPLDAAFYSDHFRLVAGERTIAPLATLIDSTAANAAKETTLDFVLPSAVAEPLLEIRIGAESTRMPIPLAARSPIATDPSLDDFGQPRRARVVDVIKVLPATLGAGQRADVGKLGFQIVEATLERETMEKASLTLVVRCSVPRSLGGGGANFWSDSVRLWIDGVPRPPVNVVNEIVGPGDSKDAHFIFDLVSMPQRLDVGIFQGGDSTKLPLSLEPLPRR